METTLHSTTAGDHLQEWWTAKQFPEKEFCQLDEKGALRVAGLGDRIVATLNHVTGDTVVQNLLDKFRELQKHVEEFEKDWSATTDKLKLLSRLGKLSDSLEHVHAIGNFEPIAAQLKTWNNALGAEIDRHYAEKEALVKEAESLSVVNNNWKDITQRLKEITEQCKNIGYVDRKRNDALWERLEKIKEHFFEEKRQHQEEISKEMLQNLDLKMELVEKAEALTNSENWKETSELYKQLMEDWKKTGRTIPEKNEALWQRFISAKNHFYDRKKLHTEQIRVDQEANYSLKLAIVEKAEAIQHSTDWGVTAKAFNDLMEEWKKTGSAGDQSNALWNRFSGAKTAFFNAKKAHANEYKNMLDENFQKKKALIDRAEILKNSNNWKEATEEINRLFDEWKQIGHAGKEHKEHLWEQFISARKHFFRRKDEDRERRKVVFEKHKEVENIQIRQKLVNMEAENAEDQSQIDELQQNLQGELNGPKAAELRAHMEQLIVEIRERIEKRSTKIASIKAEVDKAEQRDNL
jgi:ribosomal protein S15P/S13E